MVEGLRMNLSSKGKVLAADKYGKLKTVLQMLGLMVLFIFAPEAKNGAFDYASLYHISIIPLYFALLASMYSGYNYYKGSLKEVLDV
jgi:CDP-diacylglycerol--glycerol-3-phosphate 3-phosphatidyltransferase